MAGVARKDNDVQLAWFQKMWASSPLHAEAKAVFLAISLTLNRSWKKAFVQFDYVILVNSYPSETLWEIKPLCVNIRELLKLFHVFSLCWVSRNSN